MLSFEKVYRRFSWLINVNARKFAESSGEDEEELKSFLNTEFWMVYQSYDDSKGKLETFLNLSMQRKLLNYISRKNNNLNIKATPFSSLIKDGDEDESEFDVESEYDLFEHVLERIEKKKTDEDKRQLINALTKNADSITTAIVTEYLIDKDAKPTAIGRKLGIHHQTVIRKLRNLSRNYNERKFGELDAYLVS